MAYIVDTNSIRVFGNYYPERFPSFWDNIEALIADNRLTAVRHVKQELDRYNTKEHIAEWVEAHETLFPPPSREAMEKVSGIFSVRHFQQLIRERDRILPVPAADPWIIARAWVLEGCVVTEEKYKPNSAKIPNICDHFDVDCCSVEDMLEHEGWKY